MNTFSIKITVMCTYIIPYKCTLSFHSCSINDNNNNNNIFIMFVQLDVLNCHENNVKINFVNENDNLIIIHVFLADFNVRLFLTVIHHIAHYLLCNVFILYVFLKYCKII